MLADLALIGFGNVGRRFARLLDEQREQLQQKWDLTCRITGIATRRHGSSYNPDGIDAMAAATAVDAGGSLNGLDAVRSDARGQSNRHVIDQLARSPAPIRIVVETTTLDIAAGQPAIDHVRHALEATCDVVTANKGPAAFAYHELSSLARNQRRSFLFEGAVMDGVPIFNLVREAMPGVRILGFRGIVNSTTNHILTALEEGAAFGPALARMQEEGIAEADPSLDVDGWDAAAKTAALANVLLDARITPHDVEREGVGPGSATLAQIARKKGLRLRLVASAAAGAQPSVRLVELPADDPLAGLRGTSNALIFQTDMLGRVAVSQLDGGLTHTAYALLSDVIAIRRRLSSFV
jgi:homoserine dehydrogenase